MQHDRANKIRRKWEEDGHQPCGHGRYEREYFLGADTGDYVCLDCGASWQRGTKPPIAGGHDPEPA